MDDFRLYVSEPNPDAAQRLAVGARPDLITAEAIHRQLGDLWTRADFTGLARADSLSLEFQALPPLHGTPHGFIQKMQEAADMVRGRPFTLRFDGITTDVRSGAVRLSSSNDTGVIDDLRATVADAMRSTGLGRQISRADWRPRIGRVAAGGARLAQAIEPVEWLVEAIELQHWLLGDTRCVGLGSWPLREA